MVIKLIILAFFFSTFAVLCQIPETGSIKDTTKAESSNYDYKWDDEEKEAPFETKSEIVETLFDDDKMNDGKFSKYIPGFGYSIFIPNAKSLGIYQGINLSLIDINIINIFIKDIPSYIQSSYNLELLLPLKDSINQMINFSYGIRVSFESKMKRDYLIPYYELNFGWFYTENTKGIINVCPQMGIWLINKRNFNMNLFFGHFLPFSKTEIFSGHKIGLNVNYLFW